MTTTRGPKLLLVADTMDGRIERTFYNRDRAVAAAAVLNPDVATGSRTVPNLPETILAEMEARGYEYSQGFFYADVNRYAAIFTPDLQPDWM